jgi:hypothetical protein
MGLNEKKDITYVQVKNGELVIKKDGESKKYQSITGQIVKVTYFVEVYEGKRTEKATISLIDDTDVIYMLQVPTDSGYFRGLCNSLKTSEFPTDTVTLTPIFSKPNGGKPKTTFIVEQNGIALKHAFTVNHMGDLPDLEKKELKGQIFYDNSKQIEYWKNWLATTFQDVPSNNQTANVPNTVANTTEAIDEINLPDADAPFS